MHTALDELFKKFSRALAAWQEALEAKKYERASFLINDVCDLATKLRRATFNLHDEDIKNGSPKAPPK
jgi:hypothetical protein